VDGGSFRNSAITGGSFWRKSKREQTLGLGRARAASCRVVCHPGAHARRSAGHTWFLLSRPIDFGNAHHAPARRTVAAHRHRHECRKLLSLVLAALLGPASNRLYRYGGRVAARALGSSGHSIV